MIGWRILVPVKQGANGKSRLSALLSLGERNRLALGMAQHVLGELAQCSSVVDIAILSAERPDWWGGSWIADGGSGLNTEIASWREGCGTAPVAIVHADLPLLKASEFDRLLAIAADEGVALATDRFGTGSNALAIADGRPFSFRFGPESRRLHGVQASGLTVIDPLGLRVDIDTPEDLAYARDHGFGSAPSCHREGLARATGGH